MSDYKRYYVDIDEAIIDKKTRRQYETWNLIDIEAICDKLNKYDTKLTAYERSDKVTDLETQIMHLKNKNEELERQIHNIIEQRESCRDRLRHDEKYIMELSKERRELEKENQELKSIKTFAEKHGINIFNIDDAFRKCWNDNAKLVNENRKLIQIIDEADDLIKSHLSSHYNRKWENYCKNNGLDLKELDTYETITKRH